jgi:hypothetical protein
MEHSNAVMAIAGAIAACVAVLAWVQDRRRMRRRDLDRVGFMPWTPIFFWALLAAVLLIGVSGRAWLGA